MAEQKYHGHGHIKISGAKRKKASSLGSKCVSGVWADLAALIHGIEWCEKDGIDEGGGGMVFSGMV